MGNKDVCSGVTNAIEKNAILSASPPKALKVRNNPSDKAIIMFKQKLNIYSCPLMDLFREIINCNICSIEPLPIIDIQTQSETNRSLISWIDPIVSNIQAIITSKIFNSVSLIFFLPILKLDSNGNLVSINV